MKKVYKSKMDKKICGVCAGIANYFAIDPAIARILFVILAITSPISIIIYFIISEILPIETDIIDS